MKLETCPWYNCLAWAFAQVLGAQLPYRYRKYTLNPKSPIVEAFIQKAHELEIEVKPLNTLEQLQNFQFGFLVYGYFLEEVQERNHKSYEYSGFHVVLWHKSNLIHQNGCGAMPAYTSVDKLHKMGYSDPKYFAVIPKEQE